MSNLLLCLFLLTIPCFLSAQDSLRALPAQKITEAPHIDGILEEAVWVNAPSASDFIMNLPEYGKHATQRTVVKIVYDNKAIYVGAYLYDQDPKNIRRQFVERDGESRANTDYFAIGLDTYQDRQNGFQFLVTASGVQSDAKITAINDINNNAFNDSRIDKTWDAVWESKVSMKTDGWVVEMKIPFSALRFAKKDLQDWGIQFTRFIRRNNEVDTWNPMNPNVNGIANQWGILKGLEKIEPPLRLAFLPYISTGIRTHPLSADPKKFATKYNMNGGMDVRYGISESFTLDMTLVPDFGQVQSDNTIYNLTPFEVRYDERRPFFTEGTELFNKAGIFYSRRIGKVGALPDGYYAVYDQLKTGEQVVRNPTTIQLINATKISGRTRKGLGVGFLNAITAPAYAIIEDPNAHTQRRIETEALTNYNVLVLDQALRHQSSITFTNTSVIRNGAARDANVSALDIALYDKKNVYGFFAKGRVSQLFTSGGGNVTGYSSWLQYSKVSGKLQFDVINFILSDQYNPNDLGFQRINNLEDNYIGVKYQLLQPAGRFLQQRYSLGIEQQNLYNPFRFIDIRPSFNLHFIFRNWWDAGFIAETRPLWFNDFFEPRTPGRLMKRAPYYFGQVFGSTDSRKPLYVSYQFGFAETSLPADPFYRYDLIFRYRFSDRLSTSFEEMFERDEGNWGYADKVNNEIIIGRRGVKTIMNQLSAQFAFTPRMNLSFRTRHYWSHVQYQHYYKLKEDGYWEDTPYVGNKDVNFNVFNIDLIYTWDFLYGSRLLFAWKNVLSPEFPINEYSYSKNLGQVLSNPHANDVSVKVIYYLDYLKLQKKK